MKKFLFLVACITISYIATFATNRTDTTIIVNSTSHPLLINTPDGYSDTIQYPMVIGLHYCGGSASQFLEAMQNFADSVNVIVACPDYFSSRVPDEDSVMFKIVVDTVNSLFTIDSTQVYLTAMSCNSDYGLQQGLRTAYPFRGIFPWAPWSSSSSVDLYNYESSMPTVISIGTNDQKLSYVLNIYDSLKTHQANVNLILEQDVGHTLNFDGFDNVMLRSYAYLNDTGAFSISSIDNIIMDNDSTMEVVFEIENRLDQELNINTYSSHPAVIPQAIVSSTGTIDQYSFTLSPNPRNGKVVYIIEASDDLGNNISQSTFTIQVNEPATVAIEESITDEISIYPIPVQENIFIKNVPKNAVMELIDMQGKIVYSSKIDSNGNVIPSYLPNGLYTVKIISDTIVESQTIISSR